ncbi:MAG: PrsW family intramembrane metalloprotease [Oscillochloris sp.]|nr:PrsW family intramembrane metalloprotease [Oscillochloris sp.]
MPDKPIVRCCICDTPLTPPYNLIGERAYCDFHYGQVNKPHTGFWQAGLAQLIGMAAFAGVLWWLAPLIGPLEGWALIVFGIGLALIPSLLWLIFFYRQDRLEPEPKHKIGAVFFAGFVLIDPLQRWVIDGLFRLREWAPNDVVTSLLASMLILGICYQLAAYVAVRVIVYATPEFDERMDGIVYGTVAGLGVATMLNLRFVLLNEGVAIGPGVVAIVTTALAQASFSGLLGYWMAEARFVHRPIWWVPLGFAAAALLNGLFSWLIGEVSSAGMTVEPWRSLVLGLIVALAAFFVLIGLMRRSTLVTLRRT